MNFSAKVTILKFPTLMKRYKGSPERAFRPQAGVKPLLKMKGKEALKGRQSALSPLRGWVYTLLFIGVNPLSVVF